MNQISNPLLVTALISTVSNLFMTFAWYGHLKNMAGSPWYVAAPGRFVFSLERMYAMSDLYC
ncbi:MAG: DMT family protein [Nitrosomonadales bacterium]